MARGLGRFGIIAFVVVLGACGGGSSKPEAGHKPATRVSKVSDADRQARADAKRCAAQVNDMLGQALDASQQGKSLNGVAQILGMQTPEYSVYTSLLGSAIRSQVAYGSNNTDWMEELAENVDSACTTAYMPVASTTTTTYYVAPTTTTLARESGATVEDLGDAGAPCTEQAIRAVTIPTSTEPEYTGDDTIRSIRCYHGWAAVEVNSGGMSVYIGFNQASGGVWQGGSHAGTVPNPRSEDLVVAATHGVPSDVLQRFFGVTPADCLYTNSC